MISEIAANLSAAIKTIERIINRYFTSFPFHPNDLNLKPNMGISAIIKTESKAVVPYKIFPVKTNCVNPNELFKNTNSKPTTNIVAAGVAKPIKPSVCLSSTLNLAKRNAEKRVRINAGAEYK